MTVPKFDDLPIKSAYPQHSAWGVWGDSDELGTLNHLTKDRVLEARSEIQLGERVTINWPMNLPVFPAFGRQAFEHRIISKHPRPVHDDVLHFNTQSGSQWDGLRHYGFKKEKLFYNGVTPEEIREGHTLRNGIHVMAEAGIAGRGVLLDYYAYVLRHKIEFDPLDTHAISVENLEACRREQGTEFKPGDILLIRVGYTDALGKASQDAQREIAIRQPVRFAGVECNMDVIRWIWDNQFAAVAGDSPSWEVQPMGDWSLHEYILGGFGCPIAELLDLEKLSKVCEREKRWSFFFTATPLNVPQVASRLTWSPVSDPILAMDLRGGIASPTNAMCIL